LIFEGDFWGQKIAEMRGVYGQFVITTGYAPPILKTLLHPKNPAIVAWMICIGRKWT
jgi:hypothetical protein